MEIMHSMSVTNGEARAPSTEENTRTNPNFFEAFRTSLSTELVHQVYGYLYANCSLTEEEQALVYDLNELTRVMTLSCDNHNKIRLWLQKASAMAVLSTLKSVSNGFRKGLNDYEALKSAKTCPRIALEILWLEDLGKLLEELGHSGRKTITHIRFSWSDDTRASRTSGSSTNHQTQKYQGDFGTAKVFNFLADCPNLKIFEMQFGSREIAEKQVWRPDLLKLKSFRAFRKIRLGPDARVDLEFNMLYGRSSVTKPMDPCLLEELKRGLLQPRGDVDKPRTDGRFIEYYYYLRFLFSSWGD